MRQTTVLIVEDEPVIACEIARALEAANLRVLAAADAREALQLAARHLPGTAILNFKTEHLPDGMALARLLRVKHLTRVLFITGARPQDMEASGYFYAGHEVLYKPFTQKQLRSFLFPEKFPHFPESLPSFPDKISPAPSD